MLETVKRFPRYLPLLIAMGMIPALPGDQSAPATPDEFKRLSVEELSQIDVTSPSKEPRQAFQTPVAIYVITSDEIRRSGATSIPEALRLAPGVEVARIDGNKWSIGIRGFGSRFSRGVLVLIDGRTVYTTLLAGTYWEVQDTVMEDIDRIEIIRGPGGTIWGPNAVNGVINIITKDTKDTRGTLVSAGGGSGDDQGFANFRYGGGNGKDFNYRVYTKAFTRGPEEHPDQRNFDDWRASQAGFRMDWTRRTKDVFNFQGDIYGEEAGERVQAVSYTPPFQQDVDANQHLSGGNFMARWKRTLNSGGDIELQSYYDRTNRHEPNFGELRDTFDIDFIQHLALPGRQQIAWGLGGRWSLADDLEVVSGLQFVPASRTDDLYTAFLQDEIMLVDQRLTLTLGTKLLHTNFTDFAAEPSARLQWTLGRTQTVWAAFTHAVRTPSDAEEDFNLSGYIGNAPDGTPFFARFNANEAFRPEFLNGTELGYRRLIGSKAYLDIATFYNRYHNLFSEEFTGPVFLETNPAPAHLLLPAQFGNGLEGSTKGFEVAPEWRPAGFLRLHGSWSYLMMNIRKAPGSIDIGSAPGINGASPRHQVLVEASIDFTKTVSLDLTYRYVSLLTAPQLVPAYSTGDARVAWRVHRNVELSLDARNLFQPSHAEFAGDPDTIVGIRRSVSARITFTR
ncbi:MAG TPA: TonB-dependent receptor [Bryobacteraceae bacterium]|jgi:iron complex outermembrane receptor protein|nr:TonB-dependent receptor [Bryobacteraceae bacterium]